MLVCLPLAAPIGLSPLLILTLCGSERVLIVSMEPLDDLSCLTTPGVGRPGDGLLPVPLTRCIQMHTPSPCGVCRLTLVCVLGGGGGGATPRVDARFPPEEARATARAHRRRSAQSAAKSVGFKTVGALSVTKQCNTKMTCGSGSNKEAAIPQRYATVPASATGRPLGLRYDPPGLPPKVEVGRNPL